MTLLFGNFWLISGHLSICCKNLLPGSPFAQVAPRLRLELTPENKLWALTGWSQWAWSTTEQIQHLMCTFCWPKLDEGSTLHNGILSSPSTNAAGRSLQHNSCSRKQHSCCFKRSSYVLAGKSWALCWMAVAVLLGGTALPPPLSLPSFLSPSLPLSLPLPPSPSLFPLPPSLSPSGTLFLLQPSLFFLSFPSSLFSSYLLPPSLSLSPVPSLSLHNCHSSSLSCFSSEKELSGVAPLQSTPLLLGCYFRAYQHIDTYPALF